MSRDRLGIIWAGLGLIGFGIVFLVAQLIGWDEVWPIFLVLVGLAFLVGYVVSGFRDAGLIFVGVAALLIGLFFFGFTLGHWEWGDMSWLWPVFPLLAGVAFIALFFAERARDLGTLGVGIVAIIVGIVGLAITKGLVEADIVKFWPLLLVLAGVISLVSVLSRSFRRE